LGLLFKLGAKALSHSAKHSGGGGGGGFFSQFQNRELDLDEEPFGREFIDSQEVPFAREDDKDLLAREEFEDFVPREPVHLRSVARATSGFLSKPSTQEATHRIAHHVVNNALDQLSGRELDSEELFGRDDFDHEEFFGREYDQLDERDIFDDLD
jgi:hypothetical protein